MSGSDNCLAWELKSFVIVKIDGFDIGALSFPFSPYIIIRAGRIVQEIHFRTAIRSNKEPKKSGKADCKGSHRVRKVQFFLTLFKRPLTPPLLFEHLSYFAGGVF